MTKKERIQFIIDTLDDLFPEVEVPLNHKDPYTLLIAVLLSAQCTDERVNQVTPELFKLASTPQDMLKLSLDRIQGIIRPCGLSNRKAMSISLLSKILVNEYGGHVPGTLDELEALPGVGHKTASVVICQAFNTPAFPVDTHIHRLAHRWKISDGSKVENTEKDLKKLIPKERWTDLHLKMILYGRKYCPARGHSLERCSICRTLNAK